MLIILLIRKLIVKNVLVKKIFIIISNGLDIKLKIGEKWSPIFNNINETFSFFFVKPELDEKELNAIEKIWEDFETKTRIKIAKISLEDILIGKPSLIIPFKEVMNSKDSNSITEKYKLQQPDFKDIIKFNKEDYIKLLESINSVRIITNEFFVQNGIHKPSKGKYKLEDIIIKNPFLTSKGECINEESYLEQIDKDTKEKLDKFLVIQCLLK